MTRIVHLVDDTPPESLGRYLDFLTGSSEMGFGRHMVVPVLKNRAGGLSIEADVIVSHLPISWRGMPGLMSLRARHTGTPMVHVEHEYCEGFAEANVAGKRRFKTLLASAYSMFDRVVAVSPSQAAWFLRLGVVSKGELTVIPPSVDLASFRAVPAPGGPARVFGAIGPFQTQTGFDLLVRAFRRVEDPSLRLRLIGDGPERETLETFAKGDPRIEIRPFGANRAAALAGVDAVAMPSRWEPFGLGALEARAAGRTVIAAHVDGLADQAFEGVLPVPSPTPEAWAAAIRTLARLPFDQERAPGHEARTASKWSEFLAMIRREQAALGTAPLDEQGCA
ncbi:glycosyl transferase [Roseivivax halodurans JCM 10272]|uniref:Glycosyl transferase n=1 Tax=Roseivivax halodurans JCM 10272 TaxID=1449350 RepID=X7EEE7_9RHOB|nr:glycosyltransferase family 4 protein [Roseivivax halodurans]ETX14302.1 glycosyl transferase [Roseivivax halodurans JCM 10272]